MFFFPPAASHKISLRNGRPFVTLPIERVFIPAKYFLETIWPRPSAAGRTFLFQIAFSALCPKTCTALVALGLVRATKGPFIKILRKFKKLKTPEDPQRSDVRP